MSGARWEETHTQNEIEAKTKTRGGQRMCTRGHRPLPAVPPIQEGQPVVWPGSGEPVGGTKELINRQTGQ